MQDPEPLHIGPFRTFLWRDRGQALQPGDRLRSTCLDIFNPVVDLRWDKDFDLLELALFIYLFICSLCGELWLTLGNTREEKFKELFKFKVIGKTH